MALHTRHTPELAWTYTFADVVTGEEWGTFPLSGVKFGRVLSGPGAFSGFLPLVDEKVRRRKPWALTRQRRAALYIEVQDVADPAVPDPVCVWGGPVWSRTRSHSSAGLALAGASWESWLARCRLRDKADEPMFTQMTAAQIAEGLLAFMGIFPGGDLGFTVAAQTNGVASALRDRRYYVREANSVLELLDNLAKTEKPIEFRVDCSRGSDGAFRRVLHIGEPRLGRAWADTGLTFAYPGGNLASWTLVEDGHNVDTSLVVTGEGTGVDQEAVVVFESDLGLGQIDAGYPALVGKLPLSNQNNPDVMLAHGWAELRRRYAQEVTLTGLSAQAAAMPLLGTYDPGDDVDIELEHVSLESWPAPTTFRTRMLAYDCTPDDGRVTFTVGAVA